MYTSNQQVDNWNNLSPEQRQYFNNLANGDFNRSGREFFEDEVPENLQDDPEGVDIYLNGGTVTVESDVHDRGRAGSTSSTREVEIEDRDWSHDVSKHNGGSDSADNGRFESASTNRSRGADNSTTTEQAHADAQSARDAEHIGNRIDSDPDDVTTEAMIDRAAIGLTGGSLVADAAEIAVEGILPITMGLYVANAVAEKHGKKAAVLGGLGTAVAVLTPPGQICAGVYLTYKLARFGIKAARKVAAS